VRKPEDPVSLEILLERSVDRKDYRRALELITRAHAGAVGRLCLAAVGDRGEAEELVQEILIQVYTSLPGFERRSAVRTWVFTIARRCCAQAIEKRARRRRLAGTAGDPAPVADLRAELEARGREAQLRAALSELSSGVREVMLLRYAAGLSFREVAEACGIREEAARQRASVGLRALRRRLHEQEDGEEARPPAAIRAAWNQEVAP
jgi:RNA polymerase sigma-70 factor (ECF subfamily)